MSEPKSGSSEQGRRIQVFLIADVRGYSAFTAEHGDEAAAALAEAFARISHETVGEGGGRVIELRGDEALAAFPSARQAILTAVSLQMRLLSAVADDPSMPLHVGVGIDAGEAVPVEDGYRGGALNVAARLCSRAGPGEILATRSVTHLAGQIGGVRYVDAGRIRLKKMPSPVEAVRIIADDSSSGGPDRSTSRERRHGPSDDFRDLDVLPAMFGRDQEIARIEALLDGARQGMSRAVVIRGDLGTGKTLLLRNAVAAASSLRRIEIQAVEAESAFAFAGLHALINPLRAHLDNLSVDHARALRGALALEDDASAGRLYIGAAVLALLGAAATDQPMLCTFDDAHWLDPASADALRFAARRLQAEGVVLLFAAQPATAHAFGADGLENIDLQGLNEHDALLLLENRFGRQIAPDVAASLVRATGGNPRALVEAPQLLSGRQLAGTEPIIGPLPVDDMHARAIERRIELLSDTAERALLVAAAADTHTMRVVALTEDAVTDGLEECEKVGLVELGGGHLVFPDPLVRSAAYRSASATERRAAHAALARALEGDHSARERRAWHLALSSVGPDENVADELLAAAMFVQERRGHAAAATLFEHSARLSPHRAVRDHRLYLAARAWWHAGDPGLADRALTQVGTTEDPLLVADLCLLRGRMQLASRAGPRIGEALVEAAIDVEPVDVLRAAALLSAASDALPDASGEAHAARAVELSEGAGGKTEVAARLAAARRAPSPAEAMKHLTRVEGILASDRSTATDPELILALASGLPEPTFETADVIRRLTEDSIETSRRYSVVALPHALLRAGGLDVMEGRWTDASVRFDEAERLFEETSQGRYVVRVRAEAAFVDALRGREERCRKGLLSLAGAMETDSMEATKGAVLGALELGRGASIEAVEHLTRWAANRHAAVLPRRWTPVDHVEAVRRSSGHGEAARLAAELANEIDPSFGGWVDALATSKSDDPAKFTRALEEADPLGGLPFLRARILLNAGERLRSQGLRVEARTHLRGAEELFERIGASDWTERARLELRASGEKLRRRTAGTLETLTPQELQVARLVAGGATYREAAATLFLSTKTIEYHLAKVYRKLGVSSKREMAKRLDEPNGSL